MPMPTMPKAPPPRPIRGLLPLRAMEQYPMPVEQKSAVTLVRPDALTAAISTALSSAGFSPIATARGQGEPVPLPLTTGRAQFAERDVRRVPTHTGMRVSIGVIVGAGICLGAVDGVIVGGLWYTFPWFVGGAVAAALLWWRYGRTYESWVISVKLNGVPDASAVVGGQPTPLTTGTIVWSAGRVRSVLFAGVRTAIGVLDCPIPLMESLGGVVRRFTSEIGA